MLWGETGRRKGWNKQDSCTDLPILRPLPLKILPVWLQTIFLLRKAVADGWFPTVH